MKKSSTLKGAAVLLLVALVSFMAWDNNQDPLPATATERLLTSYQTSTTRSANIAKYCVNGADRTSLVTTADLSTAKTNRKAVDTSLGIDGNALINKATSGDTGGAMSMISGSAVKMGIFVGVFLVPFVIFLWIWPFLCCCCCCPSCCPSKCCQHPEDQPYTKCELLWPTVTLILALLLIISTAIYGFVNASNVGTAFNNMGCSLAIFTDDLLNGNVTTDGSSFFTGLKVFSSNLTDLNTNLGTITSSLSDLSLVGSGDSYTYVNNINTVETTYLQPLPTNAGTGAMTLTYNTPINNLVTSGSVTSIFPAKLGTYSTSGTLLYNLYVSIEYAKLLMQGIKDNANGFSSTSGTITAQVTTIQNTINGLVTDVNSMDTKFGDYLNILKTPGTYGNMGMQGFYGFFIAFSFFSLLGVLLMACCDKPGCRHLMYFTCIFLFIGAFVAFLVAIIFSILVPLFTWTCSYIDVAVSSSSGFSSNFGSFLSASTINQITVCMPYGNGDIVTQVAGTAANSLNNLTAVLTKLNAFDKTAVQGYITGNLTLLTDTTDDYASGDVTDLDDTNANILKAISDPTNTTNKVGCNAAFDADSWVPSNNQDTSYSTAAPCKVSSTNHAEFTDCNPLSGGTCNGCIDSSQVLTRYYSTANVLATDLTAKYTGTCTFNTVLNNIWTNYYSPRFTKIGKPIALAVSGTTDLTARIKQATTQITSTGVAASVFKSIDNFDANLTTIKTSLNTIQTITDPTYGMMAGLNCKLFGEDFVNFQNTICGSFYNNLYIIRLTFGIIAWGVLFVLCCSVCAGVRHFKQVDKLKRVSDGAMRNDFDNSKQNLHKNKQ